MLHFKPAQESNIDQINKLIEASKSFWDYSPVYLKAAIELLRIDTTYINQYPCFEIRNDQDQLIGFCSLKEDVLENLWISPEAINQGAGRFALNKIKSFAESIGIKTLWTLPDPPAEEFYLKQGFNDSGESLPSRIKNGPTFKKFFCDLSLKKVITIIHNSNCSKSRETLRILESRGYDVTMINYLNGELTRELLEKTIKLLNTDLKNLLRPKEEEFKNLIINFDDQNEIISAILKHPAILERPIVIVDEKAVIARPPEKVLEIL